MRGIGQARRGGTDCDFEARAIPEPARHSLDPLYPRIERFGPRVGRVAGDSVHHAVNRA